jgi:hypothetical protein
MALLVDAKIEVMHRGGDEYSAKGVVAYEELGALYEIEVGAAKKLRTVDIKVNGQLEELLLRFVEVLQQLEKSEGSHKRLINLGD